MFSTYAGMAVSSKVQRVNPLDDPRWEIALETSQEASFFHTTSWARVLNDAYGFSPIYFLATRGTDASILLPIMEVNSWLTGRRGIALPFTDECPPAGWNEAIGRDLVGEILKYADCRQWNYTEFRGGDLFRGAPPSTIFYGHTLDLQAPPGVLFSRINSTTRTSIRKAEQSGVVIEFSRGPKAVRSFYNLLRKTRKRLGAPPQPQRFFDAIHDRALSANKGMVVLAKLNHIPIAGAVFFHFRDTVLFKFGASDEKFQQFRGNNLAMWRAIEWYAQQGFTSLDFGRTSLHNEGLRRFKLGWGTKERRIRYTKYNCRTADFATKKDESYGWHTRLFRLMPISVARVTGAIAYPHLA